MCFSNSDYEITKINEINLVTLLFKNQSFRLTNRNTVP